MPVKFIHLLYISKINLMLADIFFYLHSPFFRKSLQKRFLIIEASGLASYFALIIFVDAYNHFMTGLLLGTKCSASPS